MQVLAAWRGADCAWRCGKCCFCATLFFCYVCLSGRAVLLGVWLGKSGSDQLECAGRERPAKKERGGELAGGTW